MAAIICDIAKWMSEKGNLMEIGLDVVCLMEYSSFS